MLTEKDHAADHYGSSNEMQNQLGEDLHQAETEPNSDEKLEENKVDTDGFAEPENTQHMIASDLNLNELEMMLGYGSANEMLTTETSQLKLDSEENEVQTNDEPVSEEELVRNLLHTPSIPLTG